MDVNGESQSSMIKAENCVVDLIDSKARSIGTYFLHVLPSETKETQSPHRERPVRILRYLGGYLI